jgi:hypothetical protein
MENTNQPMDLTVLNEWIVRDKLTDQELGNKIRGYYWSTINNLNDSNK